MELNMYIDKYLKARYNFFRWRYELNIIYKITLALSFALLTGLFAQFRFYLPGTPVPVTGQVFAVFLAGILLGKWGGVSQCIYVGLGVIGIPWFAGMSSGFSYIAGPTGGYIIGFILAAFFLGYFVDKYIRSRRFLNMVLLMLFATFALIYIPGLIMLYFWLGASISLTQLIIIGLVPYIAADLIKSIIAASIAIAITPKKAYAKEVDFSK